VSLDEQSTATAQEPLARSFEQAVSLHGLGRLDEAERLYQEILECDPDHADALHNLGVICLQRGKFDETVRLTRRALRLEPEFPLALNTLSVALRHLSRATESEICCREALRLDPEYGEAYANLGAALRELGLLEEAASAYREAVRLEPEHAEAHCNLGAVLGFLGRAGEAQERLREALRLQPGYAEAHHNLGCALVWLGHHDEAIAHLKQALTIKPDSVATHVRLSWAHLLSGDFDDGWREHEWRWLAPMHPTRFAQPLWNGEDIGKRRLLLHAEQGFGDTIQFCRYAPLVASKARVILAAPRPLLRLLRSLPGVEQVVVQGELPDFDLHCPLMSLPRVFGTKLETIPATVPYLSAETTRVAAWRQRVAGLQGVRVGLVWASNVDQSQLPAGVLYRRRKSITLEHFARFADVPGVSFVSMQTGAAASQTRSPPRGLRIHDWTDEIEDFADTAALIEALDLVISIDTSAAHLAGALGNPVWLLNHFDTCWRWLRGRDDSPWYPTLRQFRQPAPGDWDSPLTAARAALMRLAVDGAPARSHSAIPSDRAVSRPPGVRAGDCSARRGCAGSGS
jgi:tetratricopeptide (TPR) repeat protein